MTHQTRAVRAGEFGEAAVREVFGLREPEIEVKTTVRHKYTVSLRLSQLEQKMHLGFVIVIYDRDKADRKGKPRKFRRTIAEAFDKPLEFIFTTGAELARLIVSKGTIRLIADSRPDIAPKFYAVLPLRFLRNGRPTAEHLGHTVVDGEAYLPGGFNDASD